MKTDTIPTPTIGEILEEEFLRPLEMTPIWRCGCRNCSVQASGSG
jgi:hypothetical protein